MERTDGWFRTGIALIAEHCVCLLKFSMSLFALPFGKSMIIITTNDNNATAQSYSYDDISEFAQEN